MGLRIGRLSSFYSTALGHVEMFSPNSFRFGESLDDHRSIITPNHPLMDTLSYFLVVMGSDDNHILWYHKLF